MGLFLTSAEVFFVQTDTPSTGTYIEPFMNANGIPHLHTMTWQEQALEEASVSGLGIVFPATLSMSGTGAALPLKMLGKVCLTRAA